MDELAIHKRALELAAGNDESKMEFIKAATEELQSQEALEWLNVDKTWQKVEQFYAKQGSVPYAIIEELYNQATYYRDALATHLANDGLVVK